MDGWRLANRATRKMPRLAGSTVAAAALVGLLEAYLGQFILKGSFPPSLEMIAARLVQIGVPQLVWASCAIAVHRFVLLGEVADRYIWQTPPQFWRFFDRLMVIQLIMQLPALVLFSSPALAGLNQALLYGFGVVCIIVLVRSMLLFPAVATDAPGAGWRNAWRDSKGRGWRLFRVAFCLAVPAMLISVGVLVLGVTFSGLRVLVMPLSPWGLVHTCLAQVITAALICAAAAAASRLYQAFGAALTRA